MLRTSLACAVLILLCILQYGGADIECYHCMGQKGTGVDPCFRSGGVTSQPKVPCKGRCAKFSFWINENEDGYVRRVCADEFPTCEEIGDAVMGEVDNMKIKKTQRFSFKYKCDYCNTTLCNDGNVSYRPLLSLLIASILVIILY